MDGHLSLVHEANGEELAVDQDVDDADGGPRQVARVAQVAVDFGQHQLEELGQVLTDLRIVQLAALVEYNWVDHCLDQF